MTILRDLKTQADGEALLNSMRRLLEEKGIMTENSELTRKLVIKVDREGYGYVDEDSCKSLWGLEVEIRNYNFKKFDNKVIKKTIKTDENGEEYIVTGVRYYSPSMLFGDTRSRENKILISNKEHIKRIVKK